MPREEFKREVEEELTGRDSEPHEIIYLKIYMLRFFATLVLRLLEDVPLLLLPKRMRGCQ